MNGAMKRFVVIALLLVASARADWRGVKEGLGPQAVINHVGRPLIESRVRHGLLVTWTYDNGGYILFENGRVLYWQMPQAGQSPLAKAIAQRSDRRVASK